jgi:hypothetical protein
LGKLASFSGDGERSNIEVLPVCVGGTATPTHSRVQHGMW